MIVIPPNEKRDAYNQPDWVSLDIETLAASSELVEQLSDRQLQKMAASAGPGYDEDNLFEVAHANSALNPAMAELAVMVIEISPHLWQLADVRSMMRELVLYETDSRYIAFMDPDIVLEFLDPQFSCDFNIIGGLGRASKEGLYFFNELVHPQRDVTLLTFNGRRFDHPVLSYHYVRNRVRPTRSLAFNRYDLRSNLDLADVLSFHGAGRLTAMEEVSLGLGLPSPKEDLDGTKVGKAWIERRYFDVARYCVGDVKRLGELAQRVLPFWRL
jgi:hypothetical protein